MASQQTTRKRRNDVRRFELSIGEMLHLEALAERLKGAKGKQAEELQEACAAALFGTDHRAWSTWLQSSTGETAFQGDIPQAAGFIGRTVSSLSQGRPLAESGLPVIWLHAAFEHLGAVLRRLYAVEAAARRKKKPAGRTMAIRSRRAA